MVTRRTLLWLLAAGIAGAACSKPEEAHPVTHTPKPLPFSELIPKLRSAAPPEDFATHHAFPLPRLEGGKLRLAVICCPAATKPGGVRLSEPTNLAFFDPETGARVELRAATQADLGGPVGHDREIGVERLAPGQTQEAFLHDQAAIAAAADSLLGSFAAQVKTVSPAQRLAAADFKRLFPHVAEAALMTYLRHVGRDWFAWLDQVVV
jgi:hypothetical protein